MPGCGQGRASLTRKGSVTAAPTGPGHSQWLGFSATRVMFSPSAVSDSLEPHGLYPARLLCLLDFLVKNTGVGCHFLLQRIFRTQGSDSHLLHWQVGSEPPSHWGTPLLAYCLLINRHNTLLCSEWVNRSLRSYPNEPYHLWETRSQLSTSLP